MSASGQSGVGGGLIGGGESQNLNIPGPSHSQPDNTSNNNVNASSTAASSGDAGDASGTMQSFSTSGATASSSVGSPVQAVSWSQSSASAQ